jgi:hypothetical protein
VIELKDIPEMLRDWRTGELRTQDFYQLFLDLLEHNEVEEVFTLLPEELQSTFAASLRASFDNDCPADDIIWIDSGRGEHPAKRTIVERARRWFARSAPG